MTIVTLAWICLSFVCVHIPFVTVFFFFCEICHKCLFFLQQKKKSATKVNSKVKRRSKCLQCVCWFKCIFPIVVWFSFASIIFMLPCHYCCCYLQIHAICVWPESSFEWKFICSSHFQQPSQHSNCNQFFFHFFFLRWKHSNTQNVCNAHILFYAPIYFSTNSNQNERARLTNNETKQNKIKKKKQATPADIQADQSIECICCLKSKEERRKNNKTIPL